MALDINGVEKKGARSSVGGNAAAASHPLFRRALEKANTNVFESKPAESQAVASSCSSSCASAGNIRTVFESQPRPAMVDAGCGSKTSTVESARALIEEAADATVFESSPSRPSADAGARLEVSGLCQPTSVVFESKPAQSRADALHSNQASNADEIIRAATEQWMSTSQPAHAVFESQPQPSAAAASSSTSVAPMQSLTSVFESAPSTSQADAAHTTVSHTAAAQSIIAHAAEHLEEFAEQLARQRSPQTYGAREAEETIRVATELHRAELLDQLPGFVFEKQPAPSVAAAKHGQDSVDSDWETDDEEEVAEHSSLQTLDKSVKT